MLDLVGLERWILRNWQLQQMKTSLLRGTMVGCNRCSETVCWVYNNEIKSVLSLSCWKKCMQTSLAQGSWCFFGGQCELPLLWDMLYWHLKIQPQEVFLDFKWDFFIILHMNSMKKICCLGGIRKQNCNIFQRYLTLTPTSRAFSRVVQSFCREVSESHHFIMFVVSPNSFM